MCGRSQIDNHTGATFEKLHLNTVIGDGWVQYIATVVAVIFGASVFVVAVKKMIGITERKMASHVGGRDGKETGNLG